MTFLDSLGPSHLHCGPACSDSLLLRHFFAYCACFHFLLFLADLIFIFFEHVSRDPNYSHIFTCFTFNSPFSFSCKSMIFFAHLATTHLTPLDFDYMFAHLLARRFVLDCGSCPLFSPQKFILFPSFFYFCTPTFFLTPLRPFICLPLASSTPFRNFWPDKILGQGGGAICAQVRNFFGVFTIPENFSRRDHALWVSGSFENI